MFQNKIIIGSAQFGNNYGISNKNRILREKECFRILNYCYRKKINIIDTSHNYGNSQKIIGNYIKANKDKKWNICSKVNFNNKIKVEDQIIEMIKVFGKPPKILYFHYFEDYLSLIKRKTLFKLCKKYKIKKIGVSLHKINDLKKLKNLKNVDIIQMPLNILDKRFIEAGTLKFLKKNKIRIYARSVFLQGMFFLKKYKKFNNKTKSKIVQITKIIKESNIQLGELSFLWVNKLNIIDKMIIGVDNLEQIKKNLRIKNNKKKAKMINEILKIKINDNKFLSPYKW